MYTFIRTPESRFSNLIDYNYAPNYIYDLPKTNGARLHYVDEGVDINGVALCLHGNPTWGYCYRHMISSLVAAGFRVIIPDMIGFGKSDKPEQEQWHTFDRHHTIIQEFIKLLDLKNITLICHDWGGLFGLNVVPLMPERFVRLVALNTMLCVGEAMPDVWYRWLAYNNTQPDLNIVDCLTNCGCMLDEHEKNGFNAPFPDLTYKSALRIFPSLIPDHPNQFGAALGKNSVDFWTNSWQGQSFVAVGTKDQILTNPTKDLAKMIRNCPEAMEIPEAGHFLFEQGQQIVQAALKYFNLLPIQEFPE